MEDRRGALKAQPCEGARAGAPRCRRLFASRGSISFAALLVALVGSVLDAGTLGEARAAGRSAARPTPNDNEGATAASEAPTPDVIERAIRRAADARLNGEDGRIVELLQPLAGPKPPPALAVALGEALWRTGKTAEARARLGACIPDPACARMLGRFELDEGDRTRALQVLTQAVAARKKGATPDLPLQVLLGEALYSVGQAVAARRLLDPLADLYQDGKLSAAPDLLAVARSLALNDFFKDANEVMAEASEGAATDAERKAVEAAWGALFLSKYNFRDADVAFRKVLAFDANDADATLGMARIDLDSDHAIDKARQRLDALLQRTPDSIRALCLRAEVALHDEDLTRARALVDKAAALAPKHREVLTLRTTLALLRDDARAAKAAMAASLAVHPGDARPLVVAAHYLELGHRYREVVATLREAIAIDPEDGRAHAALGLGLSRIADDAGARKHLLQASKLDPYHVRTANVLQVLYDGVLRQMDLLTGRAVDLRVHRSERRAYERTVLPFLQESHDQLSARYGFSPARPLQVEVFPTTEQFSVRTVGLPRLGAHAVCFGHLITSRSPSEEPFNWKLVLHHELAHVFHIQATSGRVPRWLTEGLAMRESERLDARYHMIFERALYDRLVSGKLAQIATFNLAFTQAKSGQDIMLAYYQAFFLVRYLEETHGFDKLRQLVAGHKDETPTPKLVQAIYGHSAAALDGAFAAWLRQRLARFDADYRPNFTGIQAALEGPWLRDEGGAASTLRSWRDAVRSGNDSRAARMLRDFAPSASAVGPARAAGGAAAASPGGPADGDATATDPVLRAGPTCAALYIALEEAQARSDHEAALRRAEALAAAPGGRCDGVRGRMAWALALASLGGDSGRRPAMEQLERAAAIDPRDAAVVRARLAVGKGHQSAQERAALLMEGLQLEPNAFDLAHELAELAHVALAGPSVEAAAAAASRASLPPGQSPGQAPGRLPGQSPAAAGAAAAATPAKPWPRPDALASLRTAARALEETAPARAEPALAEARMLAHEGRHKSALPVYELALERSRGPARKVVACELEPLARRAGASEDAEDAGRICRGATPPSTDEAPEGDEAD